MALQDTARLPHPLDNCAIATKPIPAGSALVFETGTLRLHRDIPEGHRFAARPIRKGERLLSWALPFGTALRQIAAGEYVCNQATLDELRLHRLGFELPAQPNFGDLDLAPYVLDENLFRPSPKLEEPVGRLSFAGFKRAGKRGVGTRNCIVLLGTSSRTAPYVRMLERRLSPVSERSRQIDGVRAVPHTEGGGETSPNNRDLLLRTLAGFIVHPNTAAVLAVDYGSEPVNNHLLRRFMQSEGYPLDHVRHRFLSLRGNLDQALQEGVEIVRGWLPDVEGEQRTRQPLSKLRVALQCGGSDAFSGVSGNPLAAWVAKEIVARGGAANLAETDELIGAESYMLDKVRDLDTARAFLRAVERYKEMAAWHGLTAEGNPSGGNRLRGLYNISLKSIGAAMKRHPDTRLDHVIEYAAPMRESGFHFMDSPGNDLESVAGQVASGANLIFFTTGNGSITNFPFVPTIKVMTTTARFNMLSAEMDVNAGAYLDGTPLADLGRGMLELSIAVASGQATQGEKAGHSQVSIWRAWSHNGPTSLPAPDSPEPDATPIPVRVASPLGGVAFPAWVRDGMVSTERINLILPTSLCSVQIARLAVERLAEGSARDTNESPRWATVGHTEGCGVAGLTSDAFFNATMIGCLTHPNVERALLLEHGCEKMHNAKFRRQIEAAGIDPGRFGFASVQLDGGVAKALQRIESWFAEQTAADVPPARREVGVGRLRLGVSSVGPVSDEEARSFSELIRLLSGSGATVVLAGSATFLDSTRFLRELTDRPRLQPNLGYGRHAAGSGLFVMDAPGRHAVESLTGLAATGVHLLLAKVADHPLPGHPMVPVLQTASASGSAQLGDVLDCELSGPAEAWSQRLLDLVVQTAGGKYRPKSSLPGFQDFQLARGPLAFSM